MQAQIDAAKQAQFSKSITPRRATSTIGDVRGGSIGASTSAVKDTGKEAENAAKKYNELLAIIDADRRSSDEDDRGGGQLDKWRSNNRRRRLTLRRSCSAFTG
jgi:hypothetical protein